MGTTLQTRKDQLSSTRWHEAAEAPLAPGQVRVRIGAFALTANNITYGAFGESMNYWQFFPTGDEAWGAIPVWGFGSVVQSAHPGVAVGERLYGYFPMADQVVLQPDRLRPESFVDAAPHRADCRPSTTCTAAAQPTRSTAPTPRTCRRCCARCSPPPG